MEPFVFKPLPEIPGTPQQRAPIDPKERNAELQRITPRLLALIDEHRRAAKSMDYVLDAADVQTVIEQLRQHAKHGKAAEFPQAENEIHAYILHRLFEELVEEPSNILFTTRTGPDSLRYDAMEPNFWLECLDELEDRILTV